ncbi:hypothetical protein ACHWQZ_G009233 [Mnemiopsis leidyi]
MRNGPRWYKIRHQNNEHTLTPILISKMFRRVVLLLAAVGVSLAQYSQQVYHHFDLARAPETKRARCIMRLNLNGTEIGTVEFRSDGTLQQLDVFMESKEISQGDHGLHVHEGAVRDYDCATARGHFNPVLKDHGSPLSFADKRHVGDFGNVIASSTGRIHWQSKFIVKESATDNLRNHGTIHMEPLLELQKRGSGKKKKGNKSKEGKKKGKNKKTKGKEKNRKGKKEKPEPAAKEPVAPEPEEKEQETKYVIQVKQPKYKYYAKYYVDSPRFVLEGLDSIVGRAVVLHAGKDDLGTGDDDGSKATGNAGSRVACCTLVAV